MNAFLLYSLKFSMCLAVIYIFYFLFLRKLTFYSGNRWFLLSGTLLSIFIPLVPELTFLQSNEATNFTFIRLIPSLNNLSYSQTQQALESTFLETYIYPAIPVIFFTGVVLLSLKLTIQFLSFFRLLRSATRLPSGGVNIFQVEKNIAPFSFGNAIFFNKNLLQPDEVEEVIRHELVHIHQKHTLDVLLFEVLCLLNWYNPFVWLLRRAARQNLEFIVDSEVVKTPGTDKRYYQYLLLKIIGSPDFRIAHPFNISSLKTRISMMNKMPSTKRNLIKYLFALPVMAGLLFACQDTSDYGMDISANEKVAPPPPPVPEVPANSTIPPPPPPMIDEAFTAAHRPTKLPEEYVTFLKRFPEVKDIAWMENEVLVLFLKSGEREMYDLKNKVSRGIGEKKYGKLPKSPPPPPAPAILNGPDKKAAQIPEDFKRLLNRNSSLKTVAGVSEDKC